MKNGKCHCKSKKPIKHGVCKEDYPRSPSLCACDCGKDCEISKSLKDWKCIKSLVYDLTVTCDEIADKPERPH